MKASLYLIIVLFILSACKSNIGSDEKPISELEQKCKLVIDSFFSELSNGRHDFAIENLLSSNPFMNKTDTAIKDLKLKFSLLNNVSGKFVGFTLLKKREISNDLAIFSYLAKYESKFYRFVFIFYNNGKEVRLYKFMFDSFVDIEIEESLKLYTYWGVRELDYKRLTDLAILQRVNICVL